MTHSELSDALARELAAVGGERDSLLETVRTTLVALESGAFFDWYQRDVILRRLRAHVEREKG